MTSGVGVCWLRRDLRLHDHAALAAATKTNAEVYAVFVFDDETLFSFSYIHFVIYCVN